MKMKPICKNCQFWRQNTGTFDVKTYGLCSCEKLVDGEKVICWNWFDDGLITLGNDGSSSSLETGELFGCIHWIKK